jgi:hypothetical protein
MHGPPRFVKEREPFHRQRDQGRTLEFLERLPHLPFRRPVDPRVRDGLFPVLQERVLLLQTAEHAPLERVVHHIFDAALHLPLVLRSVRLRRQEHRAVVLRERLQFGMHFRVVPVPALHRRFQIVDHQRLRNPAEFPERILQRAHEGFRALLPDGLAVRLARSAEHDPEHPRPADLPLRRPHRSARPEIDLRLRTRLHLQPPHRQLAGPHQLRHELRTLSYVAGNSCSATRSW